MTCLWNTQPVQRVQLIELNAQHEKPTITPSSSSSPRLDWRVGTKQQVCCSSKHLLNNFFNIVGRYYYFVALNITDTRYCQPISHRVQVGHYVFSYINHIT